MTFYNRPNTSNHFTMLSSASSSSTSSPNANIYDQFSRMVPYPSSVSYYPQQFLPDSEYSEKRSAHNALERQRREGLNNKFQELAHVLPSLRQVRRPSKSMIVAKSLEFVSNANERESTYQYQIQTLRKENEQLMRQAQLSKKRWKKKAPLTKKSNELKKRSRDSSAEQLESSPVHNKKKRSSTSIIKTMPSKSLPLVNVTTTPDEIKTSPSMSQPMINSSPSNSLSSVETPQLFSQQEFDLIETYINSIPSQDTTDILGSFHDEFFQWH